MRLFAIISVIICFATIFLAIGFTIGGGLRDTVHIDQEHNVICIKRSELLLGCMTAEGKRVSDEHIIHTEVNHASSN